ncbi:MAG: ABC transporter permease [Myxococcales bacterium]|nr:ABC transporter permease [Myxococcales bacterium]
MILEIVRFELRYHLRRPVTWIYFGVLALLAFGFMSTDAVHIGGASSRVNDNSPNVINWSVMILTIFGMVMTSAIAGTAILRDFELKAHELVFATPVSKVAYVGGRFLGAYLVTLVVFTGVPLGLMFGAAMPWVDADGLGPFSLAAHLWPFLLYTIPNTLLASALFFAVGILSRSLFAVYVQGMALFIGYSLAMSLLGDMDNESLGALVDPFGVMPTTLETRDWTIAEKNSLLMPLTGALALNRLLWSGVGLAIFGGALALFKMDALGFAGRRRRKKKRAPEVAAAAAAPAIGPALEVPTATLDYGPRARLGQLLAMIRLHVRATVRSVLFLALVVIGMIFMITVASDADALFGTTVYPVTYVMAEVVTESFSLFFFILTTLYCGELLWRERSVGCAQIHDALPVPTGLVLSAKILALLTVHALLLLVLLGTGVAVQLFKGYFNLEIGVYLGHLFGLTFPWLVLITLLTFSIHALVGSKFVGHVVVLGYWLIQLILSALDFDHRLYAYGSAPSPTYSDLNRYGPDVGPYLWFSAYWFAGGILLLSLGRLVLLRGSEGGLRARLRAARGRVSRPLIALAGASAIAFAGLGGFIFYNTNILHTYRASDTQEALQAAYEREYRGIKDEPQPRVIGVKVEVDLFPERGQFTARGEYRLKNRSDKAIDAVYLTMTDEDMEVRAFEFDRPAELEKSDKRFGLRIYRLASPLGPGEEATLRFDVALVKGGFSVGGRSSAIVENGTFLHSDSILPQIGYLEGMELVDDDTRKEQGLKPKERMASIDDEAAKMNTYIASDSDWIDFEATVSTVPDQIAIAPGYLQREWIEGDRRYFHYTMDAKILNFFSFLSARYAVKRDAWKDVAIEVYYHPGHEYNVDRMIEAVKRSLDYFTENFSPYQHRQVRILEFPRYASFAQSFPNTIPYSEAIGFIARIKDPDEDIDYPFYVTAHEVAHQWWAHQVIGANVQGATVLSESLSQYSALMVMEREYGPAQMRKFLRHELRGYLQGRSRETKKELPLMLVENQQYIHYQKGSLVFYALRDYFGEEAVNAALRELLRDFAFKGPPFPTSRELVERLRAHAPERYAYMIEDMFETITLYDNRVIDGSFRALEDGRFEVNFEVNARKLRADELGNEEEIDMDDWIEVGVFAAAGPGEGDLGEALYLEKVQLKKGPTKIQAIVDGRPAQVGVDPYNKLIDRRIKDNLKAPRLEG